MDAAAGVGNGNKEIRLSPTPEGHPRALVDPDSGYASSGDDSSVSSEDDCALSVDVALESDLRDGSLASLRKVYAKGTKDGLGRRSA